MCSIVPTTEDAFTSRLLQATVHALELYGIHLGKTLGLYAALNARGPLTATELGLTAGVAPRYAREWLEQQAVAGVLVVDRAAAPADERRYALPKEHVNALVTDEHPNHLAPLAQMVAGIGGALEQVVAAYRSGAGVPYPMFGTAFRHGQAGINRPAFLADLVERWIPADPDLHARLCSASLRVADVGCGAGWSTIAMARAFPNAQVIGFDADERSVADARTNATAERVAVAFDTCDAETIADAGRFDLILVLEALHDMARPREVLQSLRRALAPGGLVIVADEKVADRFHAPGDDIERLMYGWSIVHCLPVAMSESPSAAIGTVIRSDTIRELAAAAGYAGVDVLPVDAGFFRIYRLSPQ